MDDSTPSQAGGLSAEEASHASSELNNLLQMIAGASSMMEGQSKEDVATSKKILNESIERAERLAARLAVKAGGTDERSITPSQASIRSRSETSAKPSKQVIMVVDDEQMGLTLMKHVLTQAGFEVVTAQSGFECLDQFRQRPYAFALILLDLTMPFMDGEETFGRLKDIRANIPVLLCTGFIQRERLDRLMASGLAGFLRKPIAPDEIVALVKRTLVELRYSRDTISAIS